jgi:hypothetical protein
MNRRSFFTLAGAASLAPLVGCEARDRESTPSPAEAFAPDLEKFRAFVVRDDIEPAYSFQPLPQPAK